MNIRIIHDFLKETDEGFVLTLYLSRDSDMEFAEELGAFENPFDDRYVHTYIARKFPKTPINVVRIVDGEGHLYTTSYMNLLASPARFRMQQV